MFVVAFKVKINSGIMFSAMMGQHGANAPNFLSVSSVKKQQYRTLAGVPSLNGSIKANKAFRNPNFVNEFDKYHTTKSFDNLPCKPSQRHVIIDSIKEKCPSIVSDIDGVEPPNQECPRDTPCSISMNFSPNRKRNSKSHQTKERKHSRQNLKRQEMSSMVEESPGGENSDTSNQSLNMSDSLKPEAHVLGDFIFSTSPSAPHLKIASESSPKLQKMCFTIRASTPARKISVSDSEDSFVIFAEPGNQSSSSAGSFGNESPDLSRRSSNCESDDSFVVFALDESNIQDQDEESSVDMSPLDIKTEKSDEGKSFNHKPRNASRRPSYCESEDSFIVFDRDECSMQDEDEDMSVDLDDFDCSSEELSESGEDDEEEGHDEVDFVSVPDRKKVTFASKDKLCEVHPMIKWSFAYQAARKGPWEMFARDRSRFRDRVLRVERDIKQVFDPQLRERIYRQRFQNL